MEGVSLRASSTDDSYFVSSDALEHSGGARRLYPAALRLWPPEDEEWYSDSIKRQQGPLSRRCVLCINASVKQVRKKVVHIHVTDHS